jgi:ATP-dependent Lon protease
LRDYILSISYNSFIVKYNAYKKNISANAPNLAEFELLRDQYDKETLLGRRNIVYSQLCDDSIFLNAQIVNLMFMYSKQETTIILHTLPFIQQQRAFSLKIDDPEEQQTLTSETTQMEQRIAKMNVSNVIKEKALVKLRECNTRRQDDNAVKAKQYLEGLLSIPFGIIKKEPALMAINEMNKLFQNMLITYGITKYKTLDNIGELETNCLHYQTTNLANQADNIYNCLVISTKPQLIKHLSKISTICNYPIPYSCSMQKKQLNDCLKHAIDDLSSFENVDKFHILLNAYDEQYAKNKNILLQINKIKSQKKQISGMMSDMEHTLNKCVYGHQSAKTQMLRIIGQWMNGDCHSGYCIGFEGDAGVGKTTLAKGLAECLKDENGVSRPMEIIAIGGNAIASSLVGHGYTYMSSTWGGIVNILMEKKCMNPIILIDEIDKISKTEQGREVSGILTHILDPTQNNKFQDRYFAGIDIDLSKCLFVVTYNDPANIDKILLDRIHRIRFEKLTYQDKLEISKRHLIPDLLKKYGLNNSSIEFPDETISFIMEEYTVEAGVRKLKEQLNEIIGEINLRQLRSNEFKLNEPNVVTVDSVKSDFFKEKQNVLRLQINPTLSKIGCINGLYATEGNSIGGVLPICANYCPAEYFLELKLTGLQMNTMKESMQVALTLAWNMTPLAIREKIKLSYGTQGIHIHAGDLCVSKDGPSAGVAITCAIYSLFNEMPAKQSVAITGEIGMDGKVSAIGGLFQKTYGAMKSGITTILYPEENKRDYEKMVNKNNAAKEIELHGLTMNTIANIQDVFMYLFMT